MVPFFFVREPLNTKISLENTAECCFMARSLCQNVSSNPGKLGRELLMMELMPLWLQRICTKNLFTANKQKNICWKQTLGYWQKQMLPIQVSLNCPIIISWLASAWAKNRTNFNTTAIFSKHFKHMAYITNSNAPVLVMQTCGKLFLLNLRAYNTVAVHFQSVL